MCIEMDNILLYTFCGSSVCGYFTAALVGMTTISCDSSHSTSGSAPPSNPPSTPIASLVGFLVGGASSPSGLVGAGG